MREQTWRCCAWIDRGDGEYEQCGAPTTSVDPLRGGACCAAHRRSEATQQMTCCQCGTEIAPGARWEFYEADHKRRKDGTDPVICNPCLRALLTSTIQALGRVPEEAWS